MRSAVSFVLDGKIVTVEPGKSPGVPPTTTVLNYLRSLPAHQGVKEGCAEGDCGACTVVLGSAAGGRMRYAAVDSCLVFLPMLHRKHLITVENLKSESGALHPVQQSMVDTNGSQCGYCTPGIVMSLFALYKSIDGPDRNDIEDCLAGNLCRCTGYRSIVEAGATACVHGCKDRFSEEEDGTLRLLASIPGESIRIQAGEQVYFRPASLGEAVALKHNHPQAVVLCGATDIALRVTKNHDLLKEVIDLSAVEELQGIGESKEAITAGAGAVLSDLMPRVRESFPALYDMLDVFGSRQIRNMATLGGNLGTASPIGDTLPVLMAYGASVVLESLNGRRTVPLDRYFTGYRRTLRKEDELITSIVIPKNANGARVRSYKVSRRRDLDISTVSAGFSVDIDASSRVRSILLAYGGMAERPKRAEGTEKFLLNKAWDRDTVGQAMELVDADFTPLSDVRGGAEMRRAAARNLLLKFWNDTSNGGAA